ncbi:hypothetical protein BKA57DRAFT_540813, partial [Linnemannia elongata]
SSVYTLLFLLPSSYFVLLIYTHTHTLTRFSHQRLALHTPHTEQFPQRDVRRTQPSFFRVYSQRYVARCLSNKRKPKL